MKEEKQTFVPANIQISLLFQTELKKLSLLSLLMLNIDLG
jgi:hypothetical protein